MYKLHSPVITLEPFMESRQGIILSALKSCAILYIISLTGTLPREDRGQHTSVFVTRADGPSFQLAGAKLTVLSKKN